MRFFLLLVGMLTASTIIGVALVEVASPGRTVVLGDVGLMGPDGRGWGHQHPSEIYNGGDASGMIFAIRWSSWGGAVAVGRGANPTFKPGGGYYRRPVTVELRAFDVRRCTPNGPLAYSRLSARSQLRPGGALGPWAILQPDMCINCDPAVTRAFVRGLQLDRELLAAVDADTSQRSDC